MALPKAFVISETETSFVVLDEKTLSYTVMEKPFTLGTIIKLPNGTDVQLSTMEVNPKNMFYALKEREYNITRKRKKYESIKAQKAPVVKNTNEIPLLVKDLIVV